MKRLPIVALATCVVLMAAPPVFAEEPVIEDVLAILKERGIVDESQYTELVAKNERYESRESALLGRIELSGDFRGRFENFFFDDDALGGTKADRNRGRYRFRLQGKAKVNDHVTAVFRLASGEGDHRSTNRSFGNSSDFDPDAIDLDRAYLELRPGEGGSKLVIGKMGNPFRWKNGKDYMLFDGDINPEGVAFQWKGELGAASAFANAGYMVIDENSGAKDPHFLGLQAGLSTGLADGLTLGGRASWYSFGSVNAGFLASGASNGNVALTEMEEGFDVVELAGYLRWEGVEDWPMLFYAHWAQNLDASDLVTGSEDDTGWGVGFEIGDKKAFARFGVGYYELEADFFPAQFIDSDLTDGKTNREGWTLYGSREIYRNTELGITLFMSEEIEASPLYSNSIGGSDRVRIQTDLKVKF